MTFEAFQGEVAALTAVPFVPVPFPPAAPGAEGPEAGAWAELARTFEKAEPETFRGGAIVSCSLGREEKTWGLTPKAWPKIPLEIAANKDAYKGLSEVTVPGI